MEGDGRGKGGGARRCEEALIVLLACVQLY